MMTPRPIWKLRFPSFWGIALLTVFLLISWLPSTPVKALSTVPDDACYVYPSPAVAGSNSAAWVVYNMPSSGLAEIWIYNESGDLVAYKAEQKSAGPRQQTGLSLFYYRSGVYFCRVFLTMDDGTTSSLKVFKFVVTSQ